MTIILALKLVLTIVSVVSSLFLIASGCALAEAEIKQGKYHDDANMQRYLAAGIALMQAVIIIIAVFL